MSYYSIPVCLAGLALVAVSVSPAVAQLPATSPMPLNNPERLVASAVKVDEAPTIDGVLDENMWTSAPPLGEFVQAEPFTGMPGSERTEVRLLYDDDAIYVGVMLYDRDPSLIVTTDTRRDAGLDDMDSFQMIFDTFHDQQNGFVFGTNVAGIQYDAQVRDQGEPATSWDGSWDVSTSMAPEGWIAEFRIPLRTLRYGPAPQTWGVNFFRNIQRTRERTYWSPLERVYDLGRLTSAGELRGLQLETPRNFKLLPYVVGSADRNFAPGASTDLDGDLGLDAKFGLTPSLNLDLTVNTDFAQVEVDTQQINLSRFNLRFPEKRPFFLENSGLFTVGKDDELDLFFSRRIGLDENGLLVPIVAGGRLTGKVGGVNIGVLDMQTDDTLNVPANNFAVMRVSKELPNRSGIGAMFVNRQPQPGVRHVRTTSIARLARTGVSVSASTSRWPALPRARRRPASPAATTRTTSTPNTTTRRHRVGFEYGRTGEDFNPEVGFLRERGWLSSHPCSGSTRRCDSRRFGTGDSVNGSRTSTYTRYDYLDGGLSNAEHPHRQPLGLGERLPHGHRVERKLGRVPRAIRDLSGGHRSRRRARRAVLPDARQYRCSKVDLCRNGVGGRPLSHWQPEQP